MTQIEQIIADLKEKFNVLDVIDLKDHQLYQRLQSVYQETYSSDDKIVVVQHEADVYDYSDAPGRNLSKLQQYLRQIDISNFFVIVISGNSHIDNELLQIRDLYADNDIPLSAIKSDSFTIPAIQNQTDTFCPLPWMHLYVGPDGNVLPCCVADHRYPMGNIEQDTPLNIANSKSFRQIRSNMLGGKRSKECAACYQKEDAGLPSSRQAQIKRWSVDTNSEFKPVYLDIRLNNICNLKCRMCSSYFSSSIAQEDAELYGKNISVGSILRNKQRKTALAEIIGFLPHAEKIYFAGGEPLLAPEHYEILNQLILCNNTDLELYYNTNFTRLKFRDIDITDVWKNFSNVTIGASIDAMGTVAEYVRHGTVWEDIKLNIVKLQSSCPHVNFTVTSTVGMLNILSLIELQQSGIIDISKFSLTVMTGPEHMTVAVLPEKYKHIMSQAIKQHIIWCQNAGADSLASQWHDVLIYMWDNDSTHLLGEFKRLTLTMDAHRKESFAQVFPIFQDLL